MDTLINNFPSRFNNKIKNLWRRHRDVKIPNGYGEGLLIRTGRGNLEYAYGINEPPVQEVLAELLKPGMVFFDIGANIGFFTIIAAHLVGTNGSVFSFEPEPQNAEAVRHNVSINNFNQVQVIQKAVSSTTGRERFLLSEFSGGSALESGSPPPDLVGEIEVDVVAIDDLIQKKGGIPSPDVVKIDVEGVEIDVLQGMKDTIKDFHPAIIYEIDDCDPQNYDRKQQACSMFLLTNGYSIRKLGDSYPGDNWIVGHYLALGEESE